MSNDSIPEPDERREEEVRSPATWFDGNTDISPLFDAGAAVGDAVGSVASGIGEAAGAIGEGLVGAAGEAAGGCSGCSLVILAAIGLIATGGVVMATC